MSTVGEIIRNRRCIFRNLLVFGSMQSIPDKTAQKHVNNMRKGHLAHLITRKLLVFLKQHID